MIRNSLFDDIRPYYDEEIASAMSRIVENEYFAPIAKFVFPDKKTEEVRQMVLVINTIDRFQKEIMQIANEQIMAHSIDHFSYSGIEKLDPHKRYLFISNHRDIMLDASLLQNILLYERHPTSEISFGSNLMKPRLVVDIGKSNKMYKVVRGGNVKEFYTKSLHLSNYIHYAINKKNESVWIAQRNGRTKDGIDLTDQGIIKMFYMCQSANPVESLAELNIVPISVSYQWESCDLLKTIELYERKMTGTYTKKSNEDFNSILTGIMQPKGDVHFHFGNLLTKEDLMPYQNLSNSKFNKQVAELIDYQICRNYKLTCNNYIAHDIRSKSNRYATFYTLEEKERFKLRMQQLATFECEDRHTLMEIFLGIYANPVDAKHRY